MTTRNGKIARLPKQVRHDLNGRLEGGEPGKQLVQWLNGLPEVQEVLQAEDLEADAGDRAVSDRCATLLAVELARNTEALLQQQNADPGERWRHLQELLKAVGQLRRDDHQAARLLLDQERWEREALRLDQENSERAEKEVQRRGVAGPSLRSGRARSPARVDATPIHRSHPTESN